MPYPSEDVDEYRKDLGAWVRQFPAPVRAIKYADECRPCELCLEPYCDDCEDHYADCQCPGPHSED